MANQHSAQQALNLTQLGKAATQKILTDFLNDSWMAPSDVLLRTVEVLLWRNIKFQEPTLDIGCGDGSVSKHIFAHLPKISMGVDLTPQKALATGRYVATQPEDATRMTLKSNSFATVVSNSTFEHIPNDIHAVAEVSRVLKKGGTFWLTVPTPFLRQRLIAEVGARAFPQLNDRIAHYHYRSQAEWELIFDKTGLELVGCASYFSAEAIELWVKLFRIATWVPYRRELWSYLADPRFSPYIPKGVLKSIAAQHIQKIVHKNIYTPRGGWQLLKAIKR